MTSRYVRFNVATPCYQKLLYLHHWLHVTSMHKTTNNISGILIIRHIGRSQ